MTIRLDSDVVAWFKSRKPKYQTTVNRVLRDYNAEPYQVSLNVPVDRFSLKHDL